MKYDDNISRADAMEFFKDDIYVVNELNNMISAQHFYYNGAELKRIMEPDIGSTVLLRVSKNECKLVTILEGKFFKNGGVSNFWKWKNTESGEIEEGYGEFYDIYSNKEFTDRLEQGTDGNIYKFTITNRKEYNQDSSKEEKTNYCDTCIHKEVCGEEGAREPAVTYCANRIEICNDYISRKDALNCLTATGLKKFDFILDAREKINALQSITPKKTEYDTISRESVMDIISDYYNMHNITEHEKLLMENMMERIDSLPSTPSIYSKRKHAKWVKIEPYPLQEHEYECSECLCETDNNELHFCPECGAIMEAYHEDGN